MYGMLFATLWRTQRSTTTALKIRTICMSEPSVREAQKSAFCERIGPFEQLAMNLGRSQRAYTIVHHGRASDGAHGHDLGATLPVDRVIEREPEPVEEAA